jgi:DNA processing protein
MAAELTEAELRAWLILLRAPGLGAATLRALVERHGSAEAALDAVRHDPAIPAAARAWLAAPDAACIARDLAWLAAEGHRLLPWTGADYPSLLRETQNPPAALFVVGDATLLWAPQLAIVGARNASANGLSHARAFAQAFVEAGLVITSGLAEGIDGAAHGAALDAGGKTIAVLGTGPDLVYPRRHAALAERIGATGALVTELPPGTPGKAEHFPRRNRIIAGLSLGTLVVEASLQSGSLITARLAADTGREVFAIPGSIHNPLARGCHRLIRQGATLVETAADVLESLHGVSGALATGLRERLARDESPSVAAAAESADPEYARLLAVLDDEPRALDVLAARTGLSVAELSSMLLKLELDGVVRAEHGRYARCPDHGVGRGALDSATASVPTLK